MSCLAYYTLAAILVFNAFLPVTHAQLTQTLGWGSAGSPGKRSSLSSANLNAADLFEACSSDRDILQDIRNLIQVNNDPRTSATSSR